MARVCLARYGARRRVHASVFPRTFLGDAVTFGLSPYDLGEGRIV